MRAPSPVAAAVVLEVTGSLAPDCRRAEHSRRIVGRTQAARRQTGAAARPAKGEAPFPIPDWSLARVGGQDPRHGPAIGAALERTELRNRMAPLHASSDLLPTPILPQPAFELGQRLPPVAVEQCPDWMLVSHFQLDQQPAALLPSGVTQRDLPVGLRLVAANRRDDLVPRAHGLRGRRSVLDTGGAAAMLRA